MSNPIYGGTTTTPIPFTKIDQTFNPESENAQSGVAVAEALSGIVHIAPAITINNRALQTLTVDDASSIEHDLQVKVETFDVSTDNLLTAPYNVPNTNVGTTATVNETTISLSGTWIDNYGMGIEMLQFSGGLASTLTHGTTYYSGIQYVTGDAATYPLNLYFMCSGSNSFYNVNQVVWDSTFSSYYLVIFGQQGIDYTGCEIVPVLSTAPLGSGDTGDIDLSTVSITLTGTNAETKTVYANSEGVVEGLKSSYPDFTLSTDTEGIIIDCTYKADTKTYIDKKFEELKEQLVYSVSAVNTELASLTNVDE